MGKHKFGFRERVDAKFILGHPKFEMPMEYLRRDGYSVGDGCMGLELSKEIDLSHQHINAN